jgi:ASPIC and UnbV/FG-GAP-like repeat
MGSTFADWDGDGDFDWFVSAISCQEPYDGGTTCTGNNLYRNDGGRHFSNRAADAGVQVGHWGWGAVFFDYDNDGDADLALTNGQSVSFLGYTGHEHYHHDPMRFWRNDGSGRMTEMSAAVGLTDQGEGKGLLAFDYDGDGDLDLFVVNSGAPPRLYRNDGGNRLGWLRVRPVGRRTNRDGLGVRVSLVARPGALRQLQEIGVGSHFLGQSERIAHFGLGPGDAPVTEVRLEWPASGAVQVLHDVPRNTTLEVPEPDAVQ